MYPRHCENYVVRLHILFKFWLVNILWHDTGWKWVLRGWGERPGSLFNLFWRGVLLVFALYNAFTEGRASIRRLWTLYHWIMVKIPVSQLVSFHTSFVGKERGTLLTWWEKKLCIYTRPSLMPLRQSSRARSARFLACLFITHYQIE